MSFPPVSLCGSGWVVTPARFFVIPYSTPQNMNILHVIPLVLQVLCLVYVLHILWLAGYTN